MLKDSSLITLFCCNIFVLFFVCLFLLYSANQTVCKPPVLSKLSFSVTVLDSTTPVYKMTSKDMAAGLTDTVYV